MNNIEDRIKEIETDNFVTVLLIVSALLSINGNKKIVEYYKTEDITFKNDAIKSYRASIIIATMLYVYFVDRNYRFYINNKEQYDESNKEVSLSRTRYYGSVFQLVGSTMILYYFLNSDFPIEGPSI